MTKPSFILPSAPAYDEGILAGLNVYYDPTNFVASPMTVTRATTATRVNQDGLVELVPYNLASYSEQFDNAAWTKVNATITANSITAPNGTTTADTFTDNSTSGSHALARFSTLTIATQTVSIYIKPNTLTKFYIANGSTGNAVCFDLSTEAVEGYTNGSGNAWTNPIIQSFTNGWFRVSATLVATASQTLLIGSYKVFNAASFGAMSIYVGTGETAYIWGAQLVEGTEAKDYYPTETRLNIPRLDYSLGGCPSILVEPQRTNLALYSEQFDNAAWFKARATVTANSTTSPSGTLTADSLIQASGQTNSGNTSQYLTLTAASYSFSTYAKANSKNYIFLRDDYTGVIRITWFDISNGTIGTTNAGHSASIESVGDGWYRCVITFTAAATNQQIVIGLADSNNSTTVIDSGGVFIWGAQLELGAYATSYIPTTSASVTRNADALNISGLSNNLSNGYTIFIDFSIFSISQYNQFQFRQETPSISYIFRIGNAINIGSSLYITANTLGFNKYALSVQSSGDWTLYKNGVNLSSGSGITANLQNLKTDATGYDINAMALWSTPLTDDQLEVLTGEGFDTYQLMAENLNYILQ